LAQYQKINWPEDQINKQVAQMQRTKSGINNRNNHFLSGVKHPPCARLFEQKPFSRCVFLDPAVDNDVGHNAGRYAAQLGSFRSREYHLLWGFGAICMNENEMDRYFWRSGRRWSSDVRPEPKSYRRAKAPGRVIVFLFLSFIAAVVGLVLMR
jgi:hypothetical protein